MKIIIKITYINFHAFLQGCTETYKLLKKRKKKEEAANTKRVCRKMHKNKCELTSRQAAYLRFDDDSLLVAMASLVVTSGSLK